MTHMQVHVHNLKNRQLAKTTLNLREYQQAYKQ